MFENYDFIDKKLHLLLEDAVFFMEEASESQPEAGDNPEIKYRKQIRESAFTRASILNSALMLESAANCCIATLDLSESLFSDIDKLPVINKFEYYLEHISKEERLDWGALITQKVSDLISTRNALAHPKPYKSKWDAIDERTRQVNLGKSQYLKLPNSFWMCRFHHAQSALGAAMSFLSHFFCDLCKYTEHNVRSIIFGEHDVQDPQKWIRVHEKYGFNVRFLVNVQDVKEGEERLAEHLRGEVVKQRSNNGSNT